MPGISKVQVRGWKQAANVKLLIIGGRAGSQIFGQAGSLREDVFLLLLFAGVHIYHPIIFLFGERGWQGGRWVVAGEGGEGINHIPRLYNQRVNIGNKSPSWDLD